MVNKPFNSSTYARNWRYFRIILSVAPWCRPDGHSGKPYPGPGWQPDPLLQPPDGHLRVLIYPSLTTDRWEVSNIDMEFIALPGLEELKSSYFKALTGSFTIVMIPRLGWVKCTLLIPTRDGV